VQCGLAPGSCLNLSLIYQHCVVWAPWGGGVGGGKGGGKGGASAAPAGASEAPAGASAAPVGASAAPAGASAAPVGASAATAGATQRQLRSPSKHQHTAEAPPPWTILPRLIQRDHNTNNHVYFGNACLATNLHTLVCDAQHCCGIAVPSCQLCSNGPELVEI
jgi:hypothetical protein